MPYEKLKAMEKRADIISKKTGDLKLYSKVASGYRWMRKYEDTDRVWEKYTNRLKGKSVLPIQAVEYFLSTKQIKKAVKNLERMIEVPIVERRYYELLASGYELLLDNVNTIRFNLILMTEDEIFKDYDIYQNWVEEISEKKFKDNKHYLEKIFKAYAKLGRKDLVISYAKLISEKISNSSSISFALGEILFELLLQNEAIIYYEKLEDIKTSREYYWMNLAGRYEEMKDLEKAKYFWKKLCEIRPQTIFYLEKYAEILETLGEKSEALKIYFKVLKLKEMELESYWMDEFHFSPIYAQFEAQRGKRGKALPKLSFPKRKKRKSIGLRKSKARKKIRGLKFKIIELLDELEGQEKSIPLLHDLLKETPDNIGLLERLGYSYYEINKNKEAEIIFERIYEKDNQNIAALEVLALSDIEKGNYEKAKKKVLSLEKIGVKDKLWLSSLKEEIFYNSEKDKHSKFCNELLKSNVNISLRVRCLQRLGKKERAINEAKKYLSENEKYKEKKLLYNQVVYMALELKDIDLAMEYLILLKDNSLYDKENEEQSKYLDEIKVQQKKSLAWTFDNKLMFISFDSFDYINNELSVLKGVKERHSVGVSSQKTKVVKVGEQNEHYLAPHYKYSYENGDIHLRPFFRVVGDRSSSYLQLDASSYSERNYISFAAFLNKPMWRTRGLAESNQSSKSGIVLYDSFQFKKRDRLEFSFEGDEFKLGNDSSLYHSESIHYWKTLDSFEAGVFLQSSFLMAKDNTLREEITPESRPYGIKGKFKGLTQFKENAKMKFSIGVELGGDFGRKLDFGKIYGAGLISTYHWGQDEEIELGIKYSSETVNDLDGDSLFLNLNVNLWM
jgi:hypothetical protein